MEKVELIFEDEFYKTPVNEIASICDPVFVQLAISGEFIYSSDEEEVGDDADTWRDSNCFIHVNDLPRKGEETIEELLAEAKKPQGGYLGLNGRYLCITHTAVQAICYNGVRHSFGKNAEWVTGDWVWL